MTDRIAEVQHLAAQTRAQLEGRRVYLDYGTYAKFRGKIRMGAE